jgi:hypothetical protein
MVEMGTLTACVQGTRLLGLNGTISFTRAPSTTTIIVPIEMLRFLLPEETASHNQIKRLSYRMLLLLDIHNTLLNIMAFC